MNNREHHDSDAPTTPPCRSSGETPDETENADLVPIGYWQTADQFAHDLAQALGLDREIADLDPLWKPYLSVDWERFTADLKRDYSFLHHPSWDGVLVCERPRISVPDDIGLRIGPSPPPVSSDLPEGRP